MFQGAGWYGFDLIGEDVHADIVRGEGDKVSMKGPVKLKRGAVRAHLHQTRVQCTPSVHPIPLKKSRQYSARS